MKTNKAATIVLWPLKMYMIGMDGVWVSLNSLTVATLFLYNFRGGTKKQKELVFHKEGLDKR